MRRSRSFLAFAICLLAATGCATVLPSDQPVVKKPIKELDVEVSDTTQSATLPLSLANGYSGMAKIAEDRYLVVHDTKAHRDNARLGLITVGGENGPVYQPLAATDWLHEGGRASDLESACALPGRDNEALVAESGTWEGRYGRLFHVRVEGDTATVIRALPIPNLADNDPNTIGDNFEGIACVADASGRVLVILGERGGTRHNPEGSLRWATFAPERSALHWSLTGLSGVMVSAPGGWVSPESKRDIADLYLDPEGILWAVASEDAGDDGPFRSLIYAVAKIDPSLQFPIDVIADPTVAWTLEGFKVEALSAGPDHLPLAPLSFATEDENLGGVWRALYPSAQD